MMKRRDSRIVLLIATAFGLAALGCEPGGVGDPCIPEDEYRPDFSNYGIDEVNIESSSFQCETRLCLVNHFQGRVSCPYGQTAEVAEAAANGAAKPECTVPGTVEPIVVAVAAQLSERQDEKAVYCSCRCGGPDQNARYCECPDGYRCTKLVDDLGLGKGQLAGSYCVRNGAVYDDQRKPSLTQCTRGTVPCKEND